MDLLMAPVDRRSQTSFQHMIEVVKPFGVLDTILAWCRDNLQSEWGWVLVNPSSDIVPGLYRFYFDSERDYLTFVLKWT
jgi:hypothetical protein